MTDSPDTDALIRECAEWLRGLAAIFEGDLGQSIINGVRLHAAQNWLKENPSMVLCMAESSRLAAQTMLTATGIYLAKGGEITAENRHAISRLLIKSEHLLSKKGGEARANRTMLNIAMVLLVEGLRRKHQIKPRRNLASAHRASGCDIVVEAFDLSGIGVKTTYEAVKRVWDKRKNLLAQIPQPHDIGDDLFGAMTRDFNSYIETVATADLSVSAGSVRSKIPKSNRTTPIAKGPLMPLSEQIGANDGSPHTSQTTRREPDRP
jgi:hypothetical protein